MPSKLYRIVIERHVRTTSLRLREALAGAAGSGEPPDDDVLGKSSPNERPDDDARSVKVKHPVATSKPTDAVVAA